MHFDFSVILKITAGNMSVAIYVIIVSIFGKLLQPGYFFALIFIWHFWLEVSRWMHPWFCPCLHCYSDCLPVKMLHITGEYIDGDRMINRQEMSCHKLEKCICTCFRLVL